MAFAALVKQLVLRPFFDRAYVGFAVGKSDAQFLPLFQRVDITDDLPVGVFSDRETML